MREQGQVAPYAMETFARSTAALAIVVLIAACQPRPQPTAPAAPSPRGSETVARINSLLEAGQVGSDAPFKRLLASEKQRSDHRAPAGLRALLGGFEVLRMSMAQGIAHGEGRLDVSWFLAELGIVGEAKATNARIDRVLTEQGFQFASGGDRMRLYRKTTKSAEHEVAMEAAAPWVGGKRQACGTSVSWRIRALEKSPAPRLRHTLAALPYLRDGRVSARLFDALADQRIERIDLGGTWTRYYTLSLNFAATDSESEATVLHGKVLAVLQAQGFEISKRSAAQIHLERGRSGSVAQLIGPDKRRRVRLHLQPQT